MMLLLMLSEKVVVLMRSHVLQKTMRHWRLKIDNVRMCTTKQVMIENLKNVEVQSKS